MLGLGEVTTSDLNFLAHRNEPQDKLDKLLDQLHEVMLFLFSSVSIPEVKCTALGPAWSSPHSVLRAATTPPPATELPREDKPEHFALQPRQLGRGLCLIIPEGPQSPRTRGDIHLTSLSIQGLWPRLPGLVFGSQGGG